MRKLESYYWNLILVCQIIMIYLAKKLKVLYPFQNTRASFGGRIMGGGFGGCTINLVKNENKKDFIRLLADEFYKIYKYELDSEEVIFSNGASVI